MAFTCNIDARGKRTRFIIGFLLLLAAILAGAWAVGHPSAIIWTFAAIIAIAGAFLLFESRMGWCAVRALRFKTRL